MTNGTAEEVEATFASVLPAGLSVAVEPITEGRTAPTGEEQVLVSSAKPKRQWDFATGRWAARRALQQLGIEPSPVGRTLSGAPVWPEHVTGSISHGPGLAIALVAPSDLVQSLGVDIEQVRSFDPGMLSQVLQPTEHDRLDTWQTRFGPSAATRAFSAKEAYYKAHHREFEAAMGFRSGYFRPADGHAFRIELTTPGVPTPHTRGLGEWGVAIERSGWVVSAYGLTRQPG